MRASHETHGQIIPQEVLSLGWTLKKIAWMFLKRINSEKDHQPVWKTSSQTEWPKLETLKDFFVFLDKWFCRLCPHLSDIPMKVCDSTCFSCRKHTCVDAKLKGEWSLKGKHYFIFVMEEMLKNLLFLLSIKGGLVEFAGKFLLVQMWDNLHCSTWRRGIHDMKHQLTLGIFQRHF